jgi:EAL domain-containing protein (putative c-di-GMP-specific phosphodiesterase class I)
MRTQVMAEAGAATAWLEHDPADGPTQKTPVASFPFTIGRNDTADLHIDSSQVSREHAVITRQGRKFRVRDLGSTNGTFLNGQKIDEAMLCDGDLLVVADVEFTFFCGAAGPRRQTATAVLEHGEHGSSAGDPIWKTIFSVRRAHEMVTHRGLRVSYQPIVQLADGAPFGFEALATDGALEAQPRCEQLVPGVECRAAGRVRQLFRRVAVEEATHLAPGGRLFLAITAAESAEPALVGHLCQLRNYVGGSRQLVVQIPDSAVRSTADFRALLACLRDVQIQVAYDGYASGKARITEHKEVAPDFLKLAPSMLKSVRNAADRQRQVQLIVRASQDIHSTVIATGIDSEVELEICRELGCTLAEGNLLGAAHAAAVPGEASISPARPRELVR